MKTVSFLCAYIKTSGLSQGIILKTVLLQEESATLSTSVTSEVAVEHTQEV